MGVNTYRCLNSAFSPFFVGKLATWVIPERSEAKDSKQYHLTNALLCSALAASKLYISVLNIHASAFIGFGF